MAGNKYYVVWKGYAPGVYESWDEAQIQVSGFPDAQYRSFKSMDQAVAAFRDGYDKDGLIQEVKKQVIQLNKEGHSIVWDPNKANPTVKSVDSAISTNNVQPPCPVTSTPSRPYITRSIAVDGACGGNPGPGEYRGVFVETGKELFHFGPIQGATNNIMEFLAIVHGLGFLEKQNLYIPIYSDSVNAQLWVKNGKCKTTIQPDATNEQLFDMIDRAENWLRTHKFRVNIYKWDTKAWGEIPADFGRK